MNSISHGPFWQSLGNNISYNAIYLEWLTNIAAMRYTWTGLPEEIDPRFLELSLIERGLNVFFYDDDYGRFFACVASPDGQINMYQNPTAFLAYGADGFNRHIDASECVPIWGNYTRTPIILALEAFAFRLANIERTINTNIVQQNMPAFIKTTEEKRLTIMNLVKQWAGGEPIIVGDSNSLADLNIEYVTSGVPYIVDKALNSKLVVWSEIMTYLGINNSSVRKAERVQSAEVDSNDEQVESSALIGLDCRRLAAKQINEKYGLSISVNMNRDYQSENFNTMMGMPAILLGGDDVD